MLLLINLKIIIALSWVEFIQQLHSLHHQNSISLRKRFRITWEAAHQIVNQYDICSQYLPVLHLGITLPELLPNPLWQMDVTHIAEFGK